MHGFDFQFNLTFVYVLDFLLSYDNMQLHGVSLVHDGHWHGEMLEEKTGEVSEPLGPYAYQQEVEWQSQKALGSQTQTQRFGDFCHGFSNVWDEC